MKTGQKGIQLIKEFESFMPDAYLPTPDDVWTIGYGTTRIDGRPVVPGEKISKDKALQLFLKDLERFEQTILDNVKVSLSQNQFDALVSFTYNVGSGAFRSSTLLKKLNSGDYEGAAREFHRWNKQAGKVLRGLTRRRLAEENLFRSGVELPTPVVVSAKKVLKKEVASGFMTEKEMNEHIADIDELLNDGEKECQEKSESSE